MFPGCLQDFSRMFSGCSDGSYWPGGIWWSFQMKVWTLKIQRNLMIPNYSMIPAAAIRWFPGIRWSPAIRWSIRSMDFDNRKVCGDTSITDGLVKVLPKEVHIAPSLMTSWMLKLELIQLSPLCLTELFESDYHKLRILSLSQITEFDLIFVIGDCLLA